MIAPDELQGPFDPLRRGKSGSAHDADRSNLGQGLFIVQEIAKAHAGKVQAVSKEGIPTFVVTLPLAEQLS